MTVLDHWRTVPLRPCAACGDRCAADALEEGRCLPCRRAGRYPEALELRPTIAGEGTIDVEVPVEAAGRLFDLMFGESAGAAQTRPSGP